LSRNEIAATPLLRRIPLQLIMDARFKPAHDAESVVHTIGA
jgi:hypothetical protein